MNLNFHTEHYKIKGINVKVMVDFDMDYGKMINMDGDNKDFLKFQLPEYENFEGNMEDFVKSKMNTEYNYEI